MKYGVWVISHLKVAKEKRYSNYNQLQHNTYCICICIFINYVCAKLLAKCGYGCITGHLINVL